ncbi:FAD-dependent pyridine nucleotide-disulfide oxidoreductase [Candidatus Magnetoovum chiemensis]|nr:FAD-dependent pyridine nucleotide-disulfide oxidoreductase [Candidatus Magnetoovum chiemensis]
MTKHNPRFAPPQSWYFRDVGDTFAEFKAGGIAVVCGVNPRNKESVLGYRPCVGMVGGVVYFRGHIQGYSEKDVKLLELTDADWQWLIDKMKPFLEAVNRAEYYDELTLNKDQWKKLIPYTPQERAKKPAIKMPISDFRKNIWEKGVGIGGIFAEYLTHPPTILPYITTGADRRYKTLWNNEKYTPPCQAYCPSDIPTQKRAQLIRAGQMHEALELIMQYSPLPATVCGEICPNLCMEACTRAKVDKPLDIKGLGKASLNVKAPKTAPKTDKTIAVIGGGPAGLACAWHLALKGHTVNIYEAHEKLGGKLELCIPRERLPQDILTHELSRFNEMGINIHLNKKIDKEEFNKIYDSHDIVVAAVGAHKPRMMNIEGFEHTQSAYDFLKEANLRQKPNLKGNKVVIIGAGNVGMDVAATAYNCGASEVVAVDIQKPAAFGKELDIAVSLGTKVLWPKFTQKYDKEHNKIFFTDGTSLDADKVFVSIGDMPISDFLPPSVHTNKAGWIEADEVGHTSDPKIYAIGDATKLGLVTHAIGQGKNSALAIHALLSGRSYYRPAPKMAIPYEKIKKAFYDACKSDPFSAEVEGNRCMSCAVCRDCHMCESICYYGAISRAEQGDGSYEYIVDDTLCIGCGFCAGVCPCGIWEMVENI